MKKKSNVIDFESAMEKSIVRRIMKKHHVPEENIKPLIKRLKEHNWKSANDMLEEIDFYFQTKGFM